MIPFMFLLLLIVLWSLAFSTHLRSNSSLLGGYACVKNQVTYVTSRIAKRPCPNGNDLCCGSNHCYFSNSQRSFVLASHCRLTKKWKDFMTMPCNSFIRDHRTPSCRAHSRTELKEEQQAMRTARGRVYRGKESKSQT